MCCTLWTFKSVFWEIKIMLALRCLSGFAWNGEDLSRHSLEARVGFMSLLIVLILSDSFVFLSWILDRVRNIFSSPNGWKLHLLRRTSHSIRYKGRLGKASASEPLSTCISISNKMPVGSDKQNNWQQEHSKASPN